MCYEAVSELVDMSTERLSSEYRYYRERAEHFRRKAEAVEDEIIHRRELHP